MFFSGTSVLKAGQHEAGFSTKLPQETLFAMPGNAFRGDVVGLRVHPKLKAQTRSALTLDFHQKNPLLFPEPSSLGPQTTLQQLADRWITPANLFFAQSFQDHGLELNPPFIDVVQDTVLLRLPPHSLLSSDLKTLWTFLGLNTPNDRLVNPGGEDLVVRGERPVSTTQTLDLDETQEELNLKFSFLPRQERVRGDREISATPKRLVVELENLLEEAFVRLGFASSPLTVSFDGRDACTLTSHHDVSFFDGRVSVALEDDFALYFEDGSDLTFHSGRTTRRVCRVLRQTTDLLDNVYPVKVVTESFSQNMAYIEKLGFTTLLCLVSGPRSIAHTGFSHPLQAPSFAIKLYDDQSDPVSFPFDARVCLDINYTPFTSL